MPRELLLLARRGALLVLALSACDSGGIPSLVSGPAVPELPEDRSELAPIAPNGYRVYENAVFDENDQPHIFRGVARPSLEWNSEGEGLSAEDYQRMASWNANVVRIALNQGFWLADSAVHDPTYPARIDQNIEWAQAAGLDVILDLHWSDRGDPNVRPGQQRMADPRSVLFWQEVADRYKDNGRVMFELYNEAHDISWETWLDGGLAVHTENEVNTPYEVVGMQDLYDAVRGTGAENIVIIGGLDYAFLLSGVPDHRVQGYNIMYASHPYDLTYKQSDRWGRAFGNLSRTDPIILTEFGDFNCDPSYNEELIAYAEQRRISWTAWAWYPGGCDFPAIIEDWDGTPSEIGQVVKSALEANLE